MPVYRWTSFVSGRRLFVVMTAMLSASGAAQNFERTPYWAPENWTVTTYRAGDSREFLRCSAERHYGDGLALTIAKASAGNIVLGFTSPRWPYEDRSIHDIELRIDTGERMSFSGRVRVLPSGPIVFVDLEPTSHVIPAISTGRQLNVSSPEIALAIDLTGSAAAVASVDQCHRDGSE